MPHINIRDDKGKLIDSWDSSPSPLKMDGVVIVNQKPFKVVAMAKRNRHTEVNVIPAVLT